VVPFYLGLLMCILKARDVQWRGDSVIEKSSKTFAGENRHHKSGHARGVWGGYAVGSEREKVMRHYERDKLAKTGQEKLKSAPMVLHLHKRKGSLAKGDRKKHRTSV